MMEECKNEEFDLIIRPVRLDVWPEDEEMY